MPAPDLIFGFPWYPIPISSSIVPKPQPAGMLSSGEKWGGQGTLNLGGTFV
jgi:hypothetical protein